MSRRSMPGDSWAPYAPSDAAPWNVRRVVHLHRRAAFAATWEELQRDLNEGPGPSIDRLLQGKARSAAAPEDFESIAGLLADSAVASNDPGRLKAWWVYRMLLGPDPLGERLTLLWHDHFATSNLKVDDLAAMRRQNDTLRQHARASFGTLLGAAVRDPAMLAWLDAPANRKGHPNENLARELMELFTLGIGRFDESDVKEAARALTGWTVRDGRFHIVAGRHDGDTKTILGQSGRWSGDDLVRILLEQPATASRLARRIVGLFFGEKLPGDDAVEALADGLRQHDLNIGWAVATVLRSSAFFDGSNLRSRVAGPVETVVGTVRALELLDPPPSTLLLAEWSARMGQDLFYPPNVGGWPGGRAWLSSRGLVARANFAAAVVDGHAIGLAEPLDPLELARQSGRDDLVGFLAELLLGGEPGPAWGHRVRSGLGVPRSWDPADARRALTRVLASPEAVLC